MEKIFHSFTVNHKGKKSTLHKRGLVVITSIKWPVSITSNRTNWSHVPPDWRQWGDWNDAVIISCQRCLIWIMGKDQTNSKLMVIIQITGLKPSKVSVIKDKEGLGKPGWLIGLVPPSAQCVFLKTQDRVPHPGPRMEPASPSACACASICLSLCLSWINK